jgi:hypothetical protein
MKGVRWTRYAHTHTKDFSPALAALVSPVKIFFPHRTLNISIYVSLSPSKLDKHRAGPPVSECVSLVQY